MLLLIPGVGMGASESGTVETSVARLMMMGVGRIWWAPLLILAGG